MDKTLQKRDDQIFGRMRSVERENRELRKKLEHARHYKEGAERLLVAVGYALSGATEQQRMGVLAELNDAYQAALEAHDGN